MCMKKASEIVVLIALYLMVQINSSAQQSVATFPTKNIDPYKIAVCFNKTSNLIFPYAIKSVDRGSSAILVQKAVSVENILQVKAAKEGFATTNLSVITADGKFYSFLVNYAAEAAPLNMAFNVDTVNALVSDGVLNEAELQQLSTQVQSQASFLHKKVKEQKMQLLLKGIYLSDSTMWWRMNLSNTSLINYTPDYVHFFIRDRKRSRRTAVQESKIQPFYSESSLVVRGSEEHDLIYSFSPFTIPSNQEFVIQVTEKNGGRTLTLRVSHRTILKARLFEN